MNGSALVDDIVIVTKQAQLNPVEGGIDEPIPRVLGFTIGSPMVQARLEV
jgi:hypothetical protein